MILIVPTIHIWAQPEPTAVLRTPISPELTLQMIQYPIESSQAVNAVLLYARDELTKAGVELDLATELEKAVVKAIADGHTWDTSTVSFLEPCPLGQWIYSVTPRGDGMYDYNAVRQTIKRRTKKDPTTGVTVVDDTLVEAERKGFAANRLILDVAEIKATFEAQAAPAP
jgi:hypothetical protein